MHDPASTVVAIATPAGRGGIGAIRLSGPRRSRGRRRPVSAEERVKAGEPGPSGFRDLPRSRWRTARPGLFDPIRCGEIVHGRAMAELWGAWQP